MSTELDTIPPAPAPATARNSGMPYSGSYSVSIFRPFCLRNGGGIWEEERRSYVELPESREMIDTGSVLVVGFAKWLPEYGITEPAYEVTIPLRELEAEGHVIRRLRPLLVG